MMEDHWINRGGTDGSGFILMLVVMTLAVIGVFVLVHYFNQGSGNNNQDEAMNLLKKRFANGEIDKKEFEEKCKVLSDKQ